MKELYFKFIERYGVKGIVSLIFFPIIVVLTTPIRFFQALYASRVLLNGQWQKYNRFNVHRGINSLFYWTQALNIEKFGRQGVSPLLADGKFELSNWFHLTLFSTHSYWKFGGAVVPIIGLFGWLFFHFLWVSCVAPKIVLLIIVTVMLSSTFYANMFEMQNYNALGWMFFPIGIYGMYTGNWWIEALGWMLVSFTSFTVLFIAVILSAVYSLHNFTYYPLIGLIPSLIKIGSHFVPLLGNKESLINVLKIIGAKKKAKYIWKPTKFNLIRLIFLSIIYLQFALTHYCLGHIDVLLITLFALFALNESMIFRFADPGSLHIPIMSIATINSLLYFDTISYLSFLILLNIPSLFLDFTDDNLVIVPIRKPFLIEEYINLMDDFFYKIGNKNDVENVLFVFDNPQNRFDKIFDGYRVVLELFLYSASKNNIHLFPDWYFIWKYNYIGAPECWGRNLNNVLHNLQRWNSRYIIIYEKEQEKIVNRFLSNFELLSSFEISKNNSLYKLIGNTKFYLLRLKG